MIYEMDSPKQRPIWEAKRLIAGFKKFVFLMSRDNVGSKNFNLFILCTDNM
jgi:hypothetical protein